MDILGIGPMELILILIVALMVFGPDKLPQIGAKLGHAMRDMRRATRAISNEINATRAAIEAPAKELAEPFKDVADAAKAAGAVAAAARNPGNVLRDSVLRELNTAVQPQEPDATPPTGEHTIAPTRPADPVAPSQPMAQLMAPGEPVAALPEPVQPVAALPPPDESLAELPATEEPAGIPPGDEEPSVKLAIDPLGENDDEAQPPVRPDSTASTPPEQ